MRDSASVITHAVKGIADDLAHEMDVSLPRMYELLSKDCPYPRTKELIKAIGKVRKERVSIIKADMDALFCSILGDDAEEVTAADLHREAFEAIQSCLENKSTADREQELRELIATATAMLNDIERGRAERKADIIARAERRRKESGLKAVVGRNGK